MATIAPTSIAGTGQRLVTRTTLTSSDTLTYLPNTGQVLILMNDTAGSLTVSLDGADSTNVSFPGVPNVNVSNGYSSTVMNAGQSRAIPLDTISAYLQGVITITGGTGATAILLNPL